MIIIDNKFGRGEIVYLKTDPEQEPRMIVGITINISGYLRYNLMCGTVDTWHYEDEITNKKQYKIEEE